MTYAITHETVRRQHADAHDARFARIDTEVARLVNGALSVEPANETATTVVVDEAGRAWIAGFASAGFPVNDAIQSNGDNDSDAFLARLHASAANLPASMAISRTCSGQRTSASGPSRQWRSGIAIALNGQLSNRPRIAFK